MPYTADLRSSYCSSSLNMSWFYEAMTEMGYEFECKYVQNSTDAIAGTELSEKEVREIERFEWVKFEEHIDRCFSQYTVFKVFNHSQDATQHYERYESVWEYLQEKAEEYCNNSPLMEMTHTEEED